MADSGRVGGGRGSGNSAGWLFYTGAGKGTYRVHIRHQVILLSVHTLLLLVHCTHPPLTGTLYTPSPYWYIVHTLPPLSAGGQPVVWAAGSSCTRTPPPNDHTCWGLHPGRVSYSPSSTVWIMLATRCHTVLHEIAVPFPSNRWSGID